MMQIGQKKIGNGSPPYIIAEIGINHNGCQNTCIDLIKKSQECGVDAAKLQVFRAENFLLKDSKYYDTFSKMSFSEAQYIEIFQEAKRIGVTLFASVFDFDSIELMEKLDAPAYKVASGDITHHPLLKKIAETKKPIILSSGGSTLKECHSAIQIINNVCVNKDIAILHCVSNYPTDPSDANLASIASMKKEFAIPIGFSDHTLGPHVAIAAAALGADVIEKHFTLDITEDGLDHASSADPEMMTLIVEGCRQAYRSIGSSRKQPIESKDQITAIRRSITASTEIKENTTITIDMLNYKRPGKGICPQDFGRVVGKRAKQKIKSDSCISMTDID